MGTDAFKSRITQRLTRLGSRLVPSIAREAWQDARTAQEHRLMDGESNGLTLDEACRILNVRPPQGGKTDMNRVVARFKRLYDLNDPDRNGSFYLQSKVLMARLRIEAEVKAKEEEEARQEELERGWKPKLFK